MGRDVIGLVAFDFVLGIVFRCVMHVALIVEVSGVNSDNGPGHLTRFGIPTYVIANLKRFCHLAILCHSTDSPRFEFRNMLFG
jgi:hypothetical protein